MKTKRLLACLLATASLAALPGTATLADDQVSAAPALWAWGELVPASQTKLVRSRHGLTGQFKTPELVAGHAVTLWIMFFDNPEACATSPCSPFGFEIGGDIGRPGVNFDFHYAGGHIVNGRNTTLTGHLRAGEMSTSGWAEYSSVIPPVGGLAAPLTRPMDAEVILAIHSHGPAQTGQTLVEQMNSYLGGCVLPWKGDPATGFARSRMDIPTAAGECATLQIAFHFPPASD